MSLSPPAGSRKKKKVRGRGYGSGKGGSCGRGTKGQKARSGYSRAPGFEGGQMPLSRRTPKRGFNNKRFENFYQVVNLKDLNRYHNGQTVDYNLLLKDRLVNRKNSYVKLLGKGRITKKLHVVVNKVSEGAKKEVEKQGGSVELVEENKSKKTSPENTT